MFDPSDYQNTSGVNSGVTNYMNGLGSQGGQAGGAAGGNWLQQAGAWMNSDSMSQGMGGMMGGMSNGDMLMQSDQMGGQLFGLLAGQNQSTVGNVMKSMPGMSTIGNLWNAAFGSHINEEFVKQTELGTNAIKSHIFNSNTNADVLNDWRNTVEMSHVSKDEVGSDGWFSKKAKNKTNALNNAIDNANALQMMNFALAVNNADKNTDLRIMQNMSAYGGPINSFRKYYADGGVFANVFEGKGNKQQSLRSPHIDLAVSNPWLYNKLHKSKNTTQPYKPTTFAGRVSQIAGANELGQKYVDYASSVFQQVPVVGLGISALDLGYDINNLYHAPSWTTAKDVGLDAASLLPALRKTMKGWWMKGNSGSFVTEGGQAINNPRVASSLEVMLQPYRNAVNAGIYTGRAADFLDDSSAYLKEMWNHSPIGKAINEHSKGGYLSQAKALIRNNEGFLEKPYHDAPKGKNWRSVGYGFNDSGFREKYPEGISKHYEHGITKKQAEEELDYFLNRAEKTLKGIYGKQWNDFTDNQKAAILDTYYQRPASVGKSSRFYKAVTAGEDAGRYLGVAGFTKRNNIRQNVFGGGQYNFGDVNYSDNPDTTFSSLQEETILPVVQELDLSGITPTQAKALELNLSSPAFDLSMFGKPTSVVPQQQAPTVGTVDDFLRSYGDFDDNLFGNGGWMDFFSAWNSAQGGNNYFGNMGGNQWKPADGLQVNSSNGNVGDWLGVASTVTNTLSNWGKEDPSLGRGGGYSQFGMATYDLMKGIRDMTKQRKEPMDQKLGIPIYARGGRLFADGGGVGALGYAQIGTAALKLASNAKHQASLDDDIDEGKINRSIDRQGYSFDDAVSNVQTNGDLLDLWRNYSEMPTNLTMRDFRDKSLFDDFLNGYAASWEGFNAGQNFGPWGAAIGAIVGGASSNIASIIGRNKASNAADDANKRLERANERMLADLNYGAERVDAENDLRILQNMDTVSNAANGGKLNVDFGLKSPFVMPDGTANPLFKAFGGGLTHGSNFDTGINWVNEGGSHGENPLGGVPMGVDEQGIPNLVEEGEAIWNGDYVFSKRMKVPKKLRDKYKLPDDATFADAVAKLTKDSEERPLSNIDRATNNHILGEFADTQEEMRMAKAQRAMDREMQLRDDFINGFNVGAFGGSLFSDGGGIHIDPSKKGTFKAQASKMGMGVQEAASHILANKEDYSPAMVKKANFAKNFAHADGGSLFTNPFAYGGEMGNVFDGTGNEPNYLNLSANDQSLVRRLFGDSGFTRFMENTGAALNDPLGYFAGDEIENVMNKVANMSKPQMDAFFNTKVGQAVAKAIVTLDEMPESSAQQAGVQRWMKSTGRLARPVYKAAVDAAKRSMAQSRINARGQMRTPTPKGSRVVKETTTPAQIAKNEAAAIRTQRNSTPPVLRRTTELAPINRGTTAMSTINRGATGVTTTGTGTTGVSPYISRPTEVGFPMQPSWNATVPFYGGLGIAAGNLLNWEDESGVDAETGAARVKRPSDIKEVVDAKAGEKSVDASNREVGNRRNNYSSKSVDVEIDPALTRGLDMPDGNIRWTPDPTFIRDGVTNLPKAETAPQTTQQGFNPRATWMRQVPIWMSGLAALRGELTPADYTNADAITSAAYQMGQPISVGTEYVGDYRKRDPFDERYLENIINQRGLATDRNMMNLSGGNRATAMSGILVNDLTNQMALAEAARQAYLGNRADDVQVSDFNYRTNKGNADAQNARNLALANLNSHRQQAMLNGVALGSRLRQAIKDQRDAAISANWTNFAQGMGDWGKENGFYNMLGGLNEEGVLKYFYGDNWKTMFNNNQQNV